MTSEDAGDAGGDLGVIENALIATELGRTLARVPFGSHAIAALPVIAAHGSTALREQVLASGGASGGLVVSVAVEEDLGSPTDSPHHLPLVRRFATVRRQGQRALCRGR